MATNRKTIHFIINPKSGSSSKKSLPSLINKVLDPKQFAVSVHFTEYAGHGSILAKQAVDENINYVVAVGGDGTVNEVGRELVHSNSVMGILPSGSGNGLARDLHISLQMTEALQIISQENIVTIDYGKVNGKIFLCTCGMGFDAEVAEHIAGKKNRGTLMYATSMLQMFFSKKPKKYKIICPEGTVESEAFVVTCANAAQYGYNAFIAPHADIQDGKMNIAILKPISVFEVPMTSIQLFSKKIDKNKKMEELMTSKATIIREQEGVIHIDGDAMKMDKVLDVEIIPQGLKVIVPLVVPQKHPLHPEELLKRILSAIS